MVRFQCFITQEQYNFLKKLAEKDGITGGYVIRKGIALYAKARGAHLEVGPSGQFK